MKNLRCNNICLRALALLCLMMANVGAWGQTLDGYYKFRTRNNNGNYYLSVSTNNYQNNLETPFLRTSNTDTGDNAIWAIYTLNGSKVLVHALDGKVVVLNGNANQEVGQAVHLEANADINSNTVRYNINTSGSYYLIQPNGSNYSFNPFGGNPNDIGIYRTNNNGSQWRRDDATAPTIPTPVITRNANGTATITCTNSYAKIFYTTDGSTPTSSSTLYTGAIAGSASATINAIAYVGPEWAGENKPKSAVAESLPADVTSQSGVGYVIFSGSNYRDEGAVGTTTFNPSTCLWTGTSGGRFSNARGYYIGWPGDAAGQYTNQNLRLSDTENGTSGQKIQVQNQTYGYYYFNGNQWSNTNNNNAGRVVFSVTKNTFPERSVNPVISGGEDTFTTTGETATYAGSGASYTPSYFDYVFYNGAHHYCLTETSNATMQKPGSEVITYSWSLSCPAANATVDNSGKVTYVGYFDDDTDVTLTLTATATSGKTLTATKTIRFEVPKTDPTGVSAEDATVYVGKSIKLPVTLEPNPCYKRLEFSSGNTSIATVDAQGNVTGVAVGTATITVKAYKMNSSEYFTATATITVKDKVATPEITFTPGADGLTASTEITTTTTGAKIYYTTDGTTPTASSTEYTGSFIVNNLDVVKAIAVMTGANASYYDDSNVAELMYSAQKVPTPTINVRGYEVTFLCDEPGVTYYYTTNGSNPTTSSTQWNGTAITSSNGATIKVIATKTGFAPSEVASTTLGEAHVVYLDFTNGNDSWDGSQATRTNNTNRGPKKTWAGAFALLGYGPNAAYLREQWRTHGADANTRNMASNAVFNNATFTSTVDNNIIYLVGDVTEAQFSTLMGTTNSDPTSEYNLMNGVISSGYFKPVTISGKYANSNYNPEKYARIGINAGSKYTLNEDMRFEYVEFHGNNGTNSTDFMLAYYDLEMGEGIIMSNFLSTKDFDTYHHGYAQGVTNAAHILFYGGLTCDKRFGTNPAGAYNFDYFLPHPSGYKITIRSGYFSTISPGGTQWQNTTSLNGTMGSPNTPVKCTITIDIDHAWNDAHKSGVLGKATNGNPDCDVAVVIAGTHEGAMYGDVDIIIKSGRIDRVVNGTFGANNFVSNHPADSYFGRANILIDPREPSSAEEANYPTKNSMVVIRELYGGGLGRFKSDSDKENQSSTYFYGKSSVTINGGTFKSAIYASGAGGVNGVGDANHHTNDAKLPYLNGTTLTYGTWANYNTNNKLGITCHVGRPDINKPDFHENDTQIEETVYLSDTQANIAIHGGVFGSESAPIEGIFGGGYGFVDTELINYTNNCKPNTRAGAIFAAAGQTASTVTIDGDAEIYGNIYGAGRGDNKYRTANINYNGDNYTQLGQVAGNVALSIGGNATIHGSVYGAGKGIEGFENMARLYGNSTIVIKENATISGGVYGGGQNGSVDGDITLSVLGNAVIGTAESRANVHGGGYGKLTRVNGNVDLTVGASNDGLVINGDVYGGSALGLTNGLVSGQTSNTTNHTNVTLNAGTINGSLYGGGLGDADNAANVYAPVSVKVYGGSVKKTNADDSGCVYGANNVNGAPQNTVTVDIFGTDTPAANQYAIYSVYGGGNKAAYIYSAGPKVTVHNCDNSIEYVYGGGNAAAVASTDVTIYGGNVIGNVFGGGNGTVTAANVTGNATTKIYGGKILNVFGGSNSQGTIGGTISVTADETAEVDHDLCPINITDLYGGGNRAASAAGQISIGCATHIGSVYGGANQADITGNIALNITSGHIDNVFGGNNTSGTINGTIAVTVNDSGSTCGMSVGNVFGGGNLAQFTGSPAVNIYNGSVTGNVYGGGKGDADDHTKGQVIGNPIVTIGDNVQEHQVTIGGSVFGGGDAGDVSGTPVVTIAEKCNTTITTGVYGGGNAADVSGTNVTINGGTIGNAFGGGNGQVAAANVTENTSITIHGGTIGKAFAGSNTSGSIGGTATITVDNTSSCTESITEVYGGGNEAAGNAGTVTIQCGAVVGDVYGGANKANVNSAITLNITGGTINRVFGGNNTSGSISGNITVNINKADDCNTWDVNYVYGAGNAAAYTGTPTVNLTKGTIDNNVYGGGLGAGAVVTGTPVVNLKGCTVTGSIFGGGSAANVTGSTDVNISSGTVGNVYGGGESANVSANTDVEVTGGKVNHSVYGGGLGSTTNVGGTATVAQSAGTVTEDVYGGSGYGKVQNTAVTISGGSLRNVYGGGFGDKENDYEADINGNVNVTVSGGTLSGDVFGCNNQNGAPKGTVNVTINGTNAITLNNVYGGGNLADATVTPNVTVNGCSATITDLFGGGNAAAVGGTNVVVNGGTFTRVFAGGNGAVSAANVNGNSSLAIHGGVIGKAFGGSNMNGNITGSMSVTIDHTSACNEQITEVYGGGNQAPGGAGSLSIACGATGITDVYGGANNADVNGDIVLNITGGNINRVFGGNNNGGTISGTITVNINIDGNDCPGSNLNYVYGGGNKAAYGNAGNYPAVNIIKGTVNNDVFGGGLGSDAVVTGNPVVTICGGTVTDNVFGGGSAAAVTGNTRVVLTSGIVGNIYGGGKQADVSGNTNVNANNGTVNGSVYGGGKAANVGGNATVTIGQ